MGCTVQQSVAKSRGKMPLVGDSVVRYVGREFCKKGKRKIVSVCLLGARLENGSTVRL